IHQVGEAALIDFPLLLLFALFCLALFCLALFCFAFSCFAFSCFGLLTLARDRGNRSTLGALGGIAFERQRASGACSFTELKLTEHEGLLVWVWQVERDHHSINEVLGAPRAGTVVDP